MTDNQKELYVVFGASGNIGGGVVEALIVKKKKALLISRNSASLEKFKEKEHLYLLEADISKEVKKVKEKIRKLIVELKVKIIHVIVSIGGLVEGNGDDVEADTVTKKVSDILRANASAYDSVQEHLTEECSVTFVTGEAATKVIILNLYLTEIRLSQKSMPLQQLEILL